jgi:Cysteine-rich CPCC
MSTLCNSGGQANHMTEGTEGENRPVVRGSSGDASLSDDELVARRVAWFQRYTSRRNLFAPKDGGPYSCPCCGHLTLSERGGYEICDECGREDDGQDEHDSHIVRGGPNGRLSLDDARAAYVAGGGRAQSHRPPTDL